MVSSVEVCGEPTGPCLLMYDVHPSPDCSESLIRTGKQETWGFYRAMKAR